MISTAQRRSALFRGPFVMWAAIHVFFLVLIILSCVARF